MILRFVNVAKPPTALTGNVPASEPTPEVTFKARLTCEPGTVVLSKLMPRLPVASSASTTGCWARFAPKPADDDGSVLKTNWVGTA